MHAAIDAYIHVFENLTETQIQKMDQFVAQDIQFKDPFNDVSTLGDLQSILRKTLKDVEEPKFQISDIYQQENTYILKWHFSGKVSVLGLWEVEGLSEIQMGQDGKINRHIDYWDASEKFYMKIPILGALLRRIRQRLQV